MSLDLVTSCLRNEHAHCVIKLCPLRDSPDWQTSKAAEMLNPPHPLSRFLSPRHKNAKFRILKTYCYPRFNETQTA